MTEYTKYTIYIIPMPKPRMVRRDAWMMANIKSGKVTNPKYDERYKTLQKYMDYAMEVLKQAKEIELGSLPSIIHSISFYMPIPKSYSKKKKIFSELTIHTKRPDLDNLLKALQDILCENDSHIAVISNGLGKYYSDTPRIEITI